MECKLLLASAVAISIAAPANGRSATTRVDGPRIEARVGLDRVVVQAPVDREGKSGFWYGAEIGYDLAVASFIVGAYAGLNGSTARQCMPAFGNDEACVETGRSFTLGGRFGALVGPGLAYAKGGYSNGRIVATYRNFVVPTSNGTLHKDLEGFHVGAGYEMSFSRKVYGKIEYIYTEYDTGGSHIDFERHQALVGIGVRF